MKRVARVVDTPSGFCFPFLLLRAGVRVRARDYKGFPWGVKADFDTPTPEEGALKRTAGSAGRGRAEGRAVTGGAQGEGAKEEEKGVRIVNREVVAWFRGLGGIDTPLMRVEKGFTEGFRRTGHTGNCLRGFKMFGAVGDV
jgi:hypothetical protein